MAPTWKQSKTKDSKGTEPQISSPSQESPPLDCYLMGQYASSPSPTSPALHLKPQQQTTSIHNNDNNTKFFVNNRADNSIANSSATVQVHETCIPSFHSPTRNREAESTINSNHEAPTVESDTEEDIQHKIQTLKPQSLSKNIKENIFSTATTSAEFTSKEEEQNTFSTNVSIIDFAASNEQQSRSNDRLKIKIASENQTQNSVSKNKKTVSFMPNIIDNEPPAWERSVDASARDGKLNTCRDRAFQKHLKKRDSFPIQQSHAFFQIHPEIKRQIYMYAFPYSRDEIPVTLSPVFGTADIYPEDHFLKPWEVLWAVEGGLYACKQLNDELMTFFWTHYEFHVVLSSYTKPVLSVLTMSWLPMYLDRIQYLTIEADFSKLSFGVDTDAAMLQTGGVNWVQALITNIVDTILTRRINYPDNPPALIAKLHLKARRHAGNRPSTDSKVKLIPYCPELALFAFDSVMEKMRGTVVECRMSGFSHSYTHMFLGQLFGENIQKTIPITRAWPTRLKSRGSMLTSKSSFSSTSWAVLTPDTASSVATNPNSPKLTLQEALQHVCPDSPLSFEGSTIHPRLSREQRPGIQWAPEPLPKDRQHPIGLWLKPQVSNVVRLVGEATESCCNSPTLSETVFDFDDMVIVEKPSCHHQPVVSSFASLDSPRPDSPTIPNFHQSSSRTINEQLMTEATTQVSASSILTFAAFVDLVPTSNNPIRCVALNNYRGPKGCLSFEVGDIIAIVGVGHIGWLKAINCATNIRGWVLPMNLQTEQGSFIVDPLVPTMSNPIRHRALHDHEVSLSDPLDKVAFKKDDIIAIIHNGKNGWLRGVNERTKKQGWLPGQYVEAFVKVNEKVAEAPVSVQKSQETPESSIGAKKQRRSRDTPALQSVPKNRRRSSTTPSSPSPLCNSFTAGSFSQENQQVPIIMAVGSGSGLGISQLPSSFGSMSLGSPTTISAPNASFCSASFGSSNLSPNPNDRIVTTTLSSPIGSPDLCNGPRSPNQLNRQNEQDPAFRKAFEALSTAGNAGNASDITGVEEKSGKKKRKGHRGGKKAKGKK